MPQSFGGAAATKRGIGSVAVAAFTVDVGANETLSNVSTAFETTFGASPRNVGNWADSSANGFESTTSYTAYAAPFEICNSATESSVPVGMSPGAYANPPPAPVASVPRT